MDKAAALPLPAPFAGPAPIPTGHNATPYEQAVGLAREMADRHARGDYNTACDAQARETIDALVGRMDEGEIVWPPALIALSGTTLRRAAR